MSEDTVVLIENPDGPLKLGINEDNPYSSNSGVEVETTNETTLLIPSEQLYNAIAVHRAVIMFRGGIYIDIFLNIMMFAIWPVCLVMNTVGIYAAARYHKPSLMCYILYQCLLIVSKFAMLFLLIKMDYTIICTLNVVQGYVLFTSINLYRLLPP